MTYLTTAAADPTQATDATPPQAQGYAGQTLLDLRARVLSGLDLPWQSGAGELAEGDFSPPERPRETTFQFIDRKLNEAAFRLCRGGGCFLTRTGGQNVLSGNRGVRYASLATPDGSILWAAQAVTWTPTGATASTPLAFMGRERALLRYGTATNPVNRSAALPVQYWTHLDESGVRLLDAPGVGGLVAVSGPAVPPPLTLAADYPGWLTPDLESLLCAYARRSLCQKSADLLPRFALWDAEWKEGVSLLRAQALAENPALCEWHYNESWLLAAPEA